MNIFEQFEQVSQPTRSNNANVEMSTSGFIQMSSLEETPIFTKSKKEFKPTSKITHVAVSNKVLVLITADNMLVHMNLQQTDQKEVISLTKYTLLKLSNIFLDPWGNHLLLAFSPIKIEAGGADLMYFSRKLNKLKSAAKFRGHEITQVAWGSSFEKYERTTGPVLLGTSKGLIFETEITLEGDKLFTSSIEQYFTQIFDVGKGNNIPITGLEYFNISPTTNSSNKYLIFVATPNRLYLFTGESNPEDKPLLQQCFIKYLSNPENDTFIEVENNSSLSQIKFWSENLMFPNSFAWMTNKCIHYCQFDPFAIKSIKDLSNICEIDYTKLVCDENVRPFTMNLTEFHVLLAYRDSIKALCLLNSELIYEDNYNEAFGSLVNIVSDAITGTIWAVTEEDIFKFSVTKEERYVWRIYCDKHNFKLAKKYSKDNEAHYNQVLIKEANSLFEAGNYKLSAERYAETISSFEEICLKFIQIDNEGALKLFLRKKLDKLKPQDKSQITMVVLWLVELYLKKLEYLRLQGKDHSNEYHDLQKEFDQFLVLPAAVESVKKNKSSIYELMASHGDKNNAMKLNILYKDFEQLIKQHIYVNNFHDALDVLKGQNKPDLYYQFSPILIQEIPKHVVEVLINQGRNLSPTKLLPALVSCDGVPHSHEIIKYLEFCIAKLKCNQKAIHNLLLSLYAKYDKKKLMEYLNSQGRDIMLVNYDVYFALRYCQEKNITDACVHLSGILGLWESAVDLALTLNTDLAIEIANQPSQHDVELRKKLWLKIAKHVVSGNNDIQTAMEFLQQCDLIQIEDILPFFPDFVTIDHFKDAICKSLKEYNQHIEDLKEEMEEATKSADSVRKEIQSFRNKFTIINCSDRCEICDQINMIKPFYIFPCQHKFHSDCLLAELLPMLGPAKRNKLSDLQRQLNILNTQTIDNISNNSTGLSARDTVKAEIDNIIASECLYCGENMIRNIDMPFFDKDEYDKIIRDWE